MGVKHMNKITRWSVSFLLILVAVFLFRKGVHLYSLDSNVDGGGVEVFLLGFEVNDHVVEENIPHYARTFMITSFILFTTSILNSWRTFRKN